MVPANGPGGFPCCLPHPARVWVPGTRALVVAAWSLPAHSPVPFSAGLIISIATGKVRCRTWGKQRQAKRGCVCGLLWGVCRLYSAPFSMLVWRTSSRLRLPSRGSKVSRGREGGPREGERQRAHAPASRVLCWSLSVQGLAPARQRAGRVRLRRAHPCLSSGRVPLPCPQEWSFPCRERRRC